MSHTRRFKNSLDAGRLPEWLQRLLIAATQDVGTGGHSSSIVTKGRIILDRRKFLNALSCIGVATALPAIASNGVPLSASSFVLVEPFTPAADSLCVRHSLPVPRVGVIAVGATGGRIMSRLLARLPNLTRTVAIDNDWADLNGVVADRKVLIGQGEHRLREGNGTQPLAATARAQISEVVSQLDIAFLVVGMSGIRGAALAQVVAEVLQENRTLSIVAAITPCGFAGRDLQEISQKESRALKRCATAMFSIPNNLPMARAPESVLGLATSGLDDSTMMLERLFRALILPITTPGLVTLDLDGVREIMTDARYGLMGYGSAYGREAAAVAAERAVMSAPLGVRQLNNASGIYVLIEGHPDELTIRSVNNVLIIIRKNVGDVKDEPPIYVGATRNDMISNEFRVTILAGHSG